MASKAAPVILAVAAGLLLGLAAAQAAPPASDAKPDAAACAAVGGRLEQRGKAQAWVCIAPYADAGKTCSDVRDCMGMCLAPDGARHGQAVSGHCQAESNDFGCHDIVEHGKAQTICVD